MKLASFEHGGRSSYGIVEGDGIVDVGARVDGSSGLLALLRAEADPRRVLDRFVGRSADVALGDVRLLPPLDAPGKIICVGLNYRGHLAETGRAPVNHPTLFARWPDSHVGHGEPMVRPPSSEQFDYEGELALVIGKPGRAIGKAGALDHVFGYSCYNDGSIRDWQRHTSQFLPGKNFPASGSFGPYLVTADEVGDPTRLELTTRLNGEVMQQARLDQLIFDIPTLIHYVSAFTNLDVGDVIVTGTPDGVGAFREPKVWMKAGDRIEVDIPGVGLLANDVVDGPAAASA